MGGLQEKGKKRIQLFFAGLPEMWYDEIKSKKKEG